MDVGWVSEGFGALMPFGEVGVLGGCGVAEKEGAVWFQGAVDFGKELGDVGKVMRCGSAGDEVEG